MKDYESSHLPVPIYVPDSLQMDSLQVLPKQKKKKKRKQKKKRLRATKLTLSYNPATSFSSLDAELFPTPGHHVNVKLGRITRVWNWTSSIHEA